jgi:hypothetical protein
MQLDAVDRQMFQYRNVIICYGRSGPRKSLRQLDSLFQWFSDMAFFVLPALVSTDSRQLLAGEHLDDTKAADGGFHKHPAWLVLHRLADQR